MVVRKVLPPRGRAVNRSGAGPDGAGPAAARASGARVHRYCRSAGLAYSQRAVNANSTAASSPMMISDHSGKAGK